jgi:hypothetical protein
MSTPPPHPQLTDIYERLASLERRERRQAPLLILAALVPSLALVGFVVQEEGVVQARRVELVDATNVRRAILAADSSGVQLTVTGKNGRPKASFRLTDSAQVSVLDAGGHEVARLGAPRVQHLVE